MRPRNEAKATRSSLGFGTETSCDEAFWHSAAARSCRIITSCTLQVARCTLHAARCSLLIRNVNVAATEAPLLLHIQDVIRDHCREYSDPLGQKCVNVCELELELER